MKALWDERYSNEAFAFGENPNVFLTETLPQFTPGSALFAAEGEGRNAVYAAVLGWKVAAFDLSEHGKTKAALLAKKQQVVIDYQVGDLQDIEYKENSFDAIVLIYAHFPAAIKSSCHQKLISYLKPGGIVIFEAFSKNHIQYNSINPKVGGPKDIDQLYSIEEIKKDFQDFEIIELIETETDLSEGLYHIGKGSVIRFVGRKN
ncbi:MAG: methyltransferase domain-containing protein [Bacteroidia bacterium]|nr:methyltransferase domain-containing protein [Bacteroidia bacterium]